MGGGNIAGARRGVPAFKKTETYTGRVQSGLCGRLSCIAKDMPRCWQSSKEVNFLPEGCLQSSQLQDDWHFHLSCPPYKDTPGLADHNRNKSYYEENSVPAFWATKL
jgi:hypothetical protein